MLWYRAMTIPKTYIHFSPTGMTCLETLEECILRAYRDVGGVWTIGWGHTGPEVVQGLVWSRETAIHALQEDVMYAERDVNELVDVSLNQNQFDALIIFRFNIGEANFKNSTLVHLLNRGLSEQAAEQFDRWIYVKGVKSNGLVNRRARERKLFETPV